MPSPLSLVPSAFTVTQTLVRVEAVAEYSVPYTDAALAVQTANHWGECIGRRDVEGLMESIRSHHIFAYLHLNEGRRATLQQLALHDPALHSQLQEEAASIERAIGVTTPLRLQVFGEFRPELIRRRGINLFLNIPEELSGMTLPLVGSHQILQIGGSGEDVAPQSRRRPRNLPARQRHSDAIKGHFAEDTIKSLAEYELLGERVTPLLSPPRVSLGPWLTRIGRFTFLGLTEAITDRNLETVLRFQNQVDVLVLGAAFMAQSGTMEEAVDMLRPEIVLSAGAKASSFRTADGQATALFAPASSAVLDLDPVGKTLSISSERSLSVVSWDRPHRTKEILDMARPAATRNVFGNILGDRGAWRVSQVTLNGAVRSAHHYLTQLDESPYLYATAAEREDVLLKIVEEMTKGHSPLSNADEVNIEHVLSLKGLLLQSGLLERRDGA